MTDLIKTNLRSNLVYSLNSGDFAIHILSRNDVLPLHQLSRSNICTVLYFLPGFQAVAFFVCVFAHGVEIN